MPITRLPRKLHFWKFFLPSHLISRDYIIPKYAFVSYPHVIWKSNRCSLNWWQGKALSVYILKPFVWRLCTRNGVSFHKILKSTGNLQQRVTKLILVICWQNLTNSSNKNEFTGADLLHICEPAEFHYSGKLINTINLYPN